jgi:hypothetical protein
VKHTKERCMWSVGPSGWGPGNKVVESSTLAISSMTTGNTCKQRHDHPQGTTRRYNVSWYRASMLAASMSYATLQIHILTQVTSRKQHPNTKMVPAFQQTACRSRPATTTHSRTCRSSIGVVSDEMSSVNSNMHDGCMAAPLQCWHQLDD